MQRVILYYCFALLLPLSTGSCERSETSSPAPSTKITIAAYYFPNWGPVATSEWAKIQKAVPRFEGHQQPKVPAWGYRNENQPGVMAQKIDAAADHGIDVFIFDWYYYDEDQMSGNKYLFRALEQGFLHAENNHRMRFAIMWCNHDLGNVIAKGAVRPETIDKMMDYVIEHYFKHPSYWVIDGCPYFSIYQLNTFVESFGGDYEQAADAIRRFREKVKAAGFRDLHLNGVLFGMKGNVISLSRKLSLQSSTSYVWIHHNPLPNFPTTKYETAAERYFTCIEKGGGLNGLENRVDQLPVPYHLNISMGWDSSPRCPAVSNEEWASRRGYPFGAVIVENTPEIFKRYLQRAREWTLQRPEQERIIILNSWNEWGEGSYLEPDQVNGMGYLEAIRDVFGPAS